MKTLVIPKHDPSPHHNGFDGCYARTGNKGVCPGVEHAAWLNNLGEDDEVYMTLHGNVVTNGQVRDNWLKWASNDHIVPAQPALAQARAMVRALQLELKFAKKELAQVEAAVEAIK